MPSDYLLLFSYFSDFPLESQLQYIDLVFREMPSIDAQSLPELKGSIFGMLQFPRRYVKGLEMATAYASKEYTRQGIAWTPKEFERSYNSYIRAKTDLTGSDGRNEQALR